MSDIVNHYSIRALFSALLLNNICATLNNSSPKRRVCIKRDRPIDKANVAKCYLVGLSEGFINVHCTIPCNFSVSLKIFDIQSLREKKIPAVFVCSFIYKRNPTTCYLK